MRRPSDNLTQLLTKLQLATEKDVAECESAVRRLCQDLPEFDSVWIDALVQNRVLTPWQAGMLVSSTPEEIRVENYVKTDQLGQHTFRAVSVESRRHVVLRQLQTFANGDGPDITLPERRLTQIDEVRSEAPPSLELPRAIVNIGVHSQDGVEPSERSSGKEPICYFASGFVPGWSCDELLIRGGRIPWQAVAEIGSHLLSALSWLEGRSLHHGDIKLNNIKLRPDGMTVIVAPLVNPVADHGVSLTASLRLKDVDTIAPERVGTGTAANSRSELYSAGCVLWQLLTARPPFLSADPVNKILKSQELDVSDVRGLVPDCPDWLARLIQNMTRRRPELRPASFTETLEKWSQHCSTGTSSTKRLLKRLPDRSSQLSGGTRQSSRRSSRTASFVAASVMIVGFAFYGVQRGLLPAPLTMSGGHVSAESLDTQDLTTPKISNRLPDDEQQTNAHGLLLMPRPDAAGVVVLQSGAVYEASALDFAGVMHIESTGAAVAVVQPTEGEPWRLTAMQIVMRNVQIRPPEGRAVSDNAPATMVDCHCDVLSIDGCRFNSGRGSNRDRGLSWSPRSGITSVVSINNSVFLGTGYGLWMTMPPQRCGLENLLFTTQRSAIRCDVNSNSTANVQLNATNLTQAGGISFLDAVVQDTNVADLMVQLTCGESVLAVSTGIVQVACPEDWPLSRAGIECLLPERGNPTIVPPGVRTAIGFDAKLNTTVALQDSQIRTEALLIATPVFRGSDGQQSNVRDAAFELLDYEGPKLSQTLPGVEVSKLPAPL